MIYSLNLWIELKIRLIFLVIIRKYFNRFQKMVFKFPYLLYIISDICLNEYFFYPKISR